MHLIFTISHFVSLLDKVDYTNEQLEDIVLKFSELLEVSYSISGTLDDFVYYYFEKAAKVNSNTQLYKQAGNSIVVNVLYYILKELISW